MKAEGILDLPGGAFNFAAELGGGGGTTLVVPPVKIPSLLVVFNLDFGSGRITEGTPTFFVIALEAETTAPLLITAESFFLLP